MIHKVGVKSGRFDLLIGEIPGQLMDNRADHLQVPKLLGADVGEEALQLGIGHGESLAEVAQRGAQLAIRPAVLGNDERCQLGIGIFDLHRVLKLFLVNKHYFVPPT